MANQQGRPAQVSEEFELSTAVPATAVARTLLVHVALASLLAASPAVAIEVHFDPARHTIDASASNADSVHAADLDGDGDLDALVASYCQDPGDPCVAWYENGGSPADEIAWTEHVLSEEAKGAFWVFAADVDGDGDLDALSASFDDDKIAWYENEGAGAPMFRP